MTITKQTLRDARTLILRLLPPGNPLKAQEIVQAQEVISALTAELESMVSAERGRKVLEWRVRTSLAPTLNQYAFMKTWQRMAIRKALDADLAGIIANVKDSHAGKRVRCLRVTRFTTQPKTIDDVAADAIGGKMPIDSLVRLGVFYDDKPAFMVREAHVTKTTPGNTHVLFEVFECADEAVPCGEPQDLLLPPEPKKLTKAERAAAKAAKRLATMEKWSRAGAAEMPSTMGVVPGSPVPTKTKRRKVA
jgi:hypothetical protein